ncbi:hypothetical protein ACA910_000419 [Epithemia clementina (nom. ined.)]
MTPAPQASTGTDVQPLLPTAFALQHIQDQIDSLFSTSTNLNIHYYKESFDTVVTQGEDHSRQRPCWHDDDGSSGGGSRDNGDDKVDNIQQQMRWWRHSKQ